MDAENQAHTFISYSRVNKEFALELAKELKSAGFLVWLDQLDIPTGARWDDEIEKALHNCQIFMVILTPASISSENVKDEIGYAIDHGKRILPVFLEECAIPLRLRRFQYVDFTKTEFDYGVKRAKQLLEKLINEPATAVASIISETETEKVPKVIHKPSAPPPDKSSPRSRKLGIAIILAMIGICGTITAIIGLILWNNSPPFLPNPSGPGALASSQPTSSTNPPDLPTSSEPPPSTEPNPPVPAPTTPKPEQPIAPTTIQPIPITTVPPTEDLFKLFAAPSKWSDFFCEGNEVCTAADVNGDGRADLIAFVRDTQSGDGYADVWVGLSTGNAFERPHKWSEFFCQTNEVCTAADVNGDGRADLIAFVRETQPEPSRADVWVGLSNGNGFADANKWNDFFCQETEVCTAADVNGDGRADLIAFVRDTQSEPYRDDVFVSLSTGNAFEPAGKWIEFFCQANEVCTAADVNGDGRADLIAFVRDTQSEPFRDDAWVVLSRGNTFGGGGKWSEFFCQANEVCTAADVNGDGRADLIAFVRGSQSEPYRDDVFISLSTGNGFESPSKWSEFFCHGNEDCIAADVNGDGKADLIAFVRNTQSGDGAQDVWVSLEVK
jgi:hypothetical protein